MVGWQNIRSRVLLLKIWIDGVDTHRMWCIYWILIVIAIFSRSIESTTETEERPANTERLKDERFGKVESELKGLLEKLYPDTDFESALEEFYQEKYTKAMEQEALFKPILQKLGILFMPEPFFDAKSSLIHRIAMDFFAKCPFDYITFGDNTIMKHILRDIGDSMVFDIPAIELSAEGFDKLIRRTFMVHFFNDIYHVKLAYASEMGERMHDLVNGNDKFIEGILDGEETDPEKILKLIQYFMANGDNEVQIRMRSIPMQICYDMHLTALRQYERYIKHDSNSKMPAIYKHGLVPSVPFNANHQSSFLFQIARYACFQKTFNGIDTSEAIRRLQDSSWLHINRTGYTAPVDRPIDTEPKDFVKEAEIRCKEQFSRSLYLIWYPLLCSCFKLFHSKVNNPINQLGLLYIMVGWLQQDAEIHWEKFRALAFQDIIRMYILPKIQKYNQHKS